MLPALGQKVVAWVLMRAVEVERKEVRVRQSRVVAEEAARERRACAIRLELLVVDPSAVVAEL